MHFLRWITLTMLFLLAAGSGAPALAGQASTTCATHLTDITITGDLIVPENASCELERVIVAGTIQVEQRATLTVDDSRIAGAVRAADFELVYIQHSSIGDIVRLADGASARIEATTVSGAISITGVVDSRIADTHLGSELAIRDGRELVLVCGTTVAGNASFAGNRGGVLVGTGTATCTPNQVRGTVRVHHNDADVTLAYTTIGNDLICAANQPVPVLYGNHVGGTARGQCGAGEAVDRSELGDA